MRRGEKRSHPVLLKINIAMNVQDVPGSSDFLSIEDTSKEAKIAKSHDLELHLEIH